MYFQACILLYFSWYFTMIGIKICQIKTNEDHTQRINGTPFMRQKRILLPHRQPQVNVMDLCFCIEDVIFNVNETSLFRKQNTCQHKINAAARRSRRLHSVSIAFPQRCWRLHSAHLGDLHFLKRCGNAVRTPLWCDMGFKYITMSEINAVLALWNITL